VDTCTNYHKVSMRGKSHQNNPVVGWTDYRSGRILSVFMSKVFFQTPASVNHFCSKITTLLDIRSFWIIIGIENG
jgi:hypothetical protein